MIFAGGTPLVIDAEPPVPADGFVWVWVGVTAAVVAVLGAILWLA